MRALPAGFLCSARSAIRMAMGYRRYSLNPKLSRQGWLRLTFEFSAYSDLLRLLVGKLEMSRATEPVLRSQSVRVECASEPLHLGQRMAGKLHGASIHLSISACSKSALLAFVRTKGQVLEQTLQLSCEIIKNSSESSCRSRQYQVSNESY